MTAAQRRRAIITKYTLALNTATRELLDEEVLVPRDAARAELYAPFVVGLILGFLALREAAVQTLTAKFAMLVARKTR